MSHRRSQSDEQADSEPPHGVGQIEQMLKRYSLQSERLFGLLLEMGYEEASVLTCDAWILNCGGLPKGKFVFLKLTPDIVQSHPELGRHLILGRILDTSPLPVEEEILITLLQLHKLQSVADPITRADLQWGGLKTRLLGTYSDNPEKSGVVLFGSDLDLFLSPYTYEVYAPTDDDLRFLLNLFVQDRFPHSIGRLRYSESLTFQQISEIQIMVSSLDLMGCRSGILGMTRLGKSNLLKILADILIRSGLNLGMLIIDPSGEYSYLNEQDRTCLHYEHKDRSVRFSLNPRQPDSEKRLGLQPPHKLGINFFEQIVLGHTIIASLYDTEHEKRPDYILPLLSWQPVDPEEIVDTISDFGERTRYIRSLAMYLALLSAAGYPASPGFQLELNLHRDLRRELAKSSQLRSGIATLIYKGELEIAERQTLKAACSIFSELFKLHQQERNNPALFPPSQNTGMPYFDLLQITLLQMLGDTRVSGPKKLSPFLKFHSPKGSNIIRSISTLIDDGKVVILDLSNANEDTSSLFSKMICWSILKNQMEKFASNSLGDHYVHLIFEEAHKLFPQNDSNLGNIFNILAKEGGKYHIGMFYATQSIGTISPDLLKNSENIFITHLNDERELRILSYRQEFKDLAPLIQKARTPGFVRMITRSNRYVIPVQVNKFGPP